MRNFRALAAQVVTWDDVEGTYLGMPSEVRELQTSSFARTLTASYGTLESNQATLASPNDVTILTGQLPQTMEAAQPDVADQTYMPFFFGDARSVFYVTTTTYWQLLDAYQGFGLTGREKYQLATQGTITPLVVATGPSQPDAPHEVITETVDPAVAQRVVEGGQFRAVIGGSAPVVFGERSIGVTGSTAATATEPSAATNGRPTTNSQGGS